MENRYEFFKRLFRKRVIVFLIDGKYRSVGNDKGLIKYLKNGDISYVLIDSKFKVKVVDVKNNRYDEYLLRELLCKLVRDAKKKEMICKIKEFDFIKIECSRITKEEFFM